MGGQAGRVRLQGRLPGMLAEGSRQVQPEAARMWEAGERQGSGGKK